MENNSNSNSAVIAVVVLAVIVLAAFVAYRQGVFSGNKDDSGGVDINLPGGSNSPGY